MVVPKIAVIALVAILAVPILLGYAMNFTTSTVTYYDTNDDSVNVTPLLQNGVSYDNVHASVYDLNTILKYGSVPVNPTYVEVNTNVSTFPLLQREYTPADNLIDIRAHLYQWTNVFTYYQTDYNGGTSSYIKLIIMDENDVVQFTVNNIHSVTYEESILDIVYSYYQDINDQNTLSYGVYHAPNNEYVMEILTVGSANPYHTVLQLVRPNVTTFVNLSKGFYFSGTPRQWYITIPHYTHNLLMTIDLDSITDSSYVLAMGIMGRLYLTKSTVGSDVSWTAQYYNEDTSILIDEKQIYYNPSGNNTYQVYFNFTDLGNDGVIYDYKEKIQLRYVGDWPTLMGQSNYYLVYDFENDYTYNSELVTSSISLTSDKPKTPIMRMDDAEYRGMVYSVIQNSTYAPNNFRNNPSTTITDIQKYGTSITFGGETFTVDKDGNITIDSHKVSLSKCEFKSLPNSSYGYDNFIGNTLISNTTDPSTIIFNGVWSASVSTDSMELKNYTKTEWHAGSFGWDGIDQNFLIVGLVTCLGVFVALGIYARKSRSGGLIPLMIAVGCAAMVFFIML